VYAQISKSHFHIPFKASIKFLGLDTPKTMEGYVDSFKDYFLDFTVQDATNLKASLDLPTSIIPLSDM
jgi:hypothetical protein